MNRLLNPDGTACLNDLHRLDGKIVLVKSNRDRSNPPTAMRGTIEVRESPTATPSVSIAVDFPQMFSFRAHRRTIPLDHAGLLQLLETEDNGAYSYAIDEELE